LSPESAVLARVFIEHCIETKNEARLEAASLPVVTAFAFHLQDAYNALLDTLQEMETAQLLDAGEDEDAAEVEHREEDLAKREVILAELLRMALKLDYMDEIGRRKVFLVVRKYFEPILAKIFQLRTKHLGDMLAHPELPPGLIGPALDVLSEIMPTERELIRIVVEIIIELREDDGGDNNDLQSIAVMFFVFLHVYAVHAIEERRKPVRHLPDYFLQG
jgi:condensin complex subunit 3